jgi:hypothetical protein
VVEDRVDPDLVDMVASDSAMLEVELLAIDQIDSWQIDIFNFIS